MLDHAAQIMECAATDLELRPGGDIGLIGVPKTVTFKEIALHSLFRSGGPIAATHGFVFDGPGFDPKRASIHRLAFANLGIYTFGAHCVEVDVDTATGTVEVRRAWCAHDVGRAINPRELRRPDPGRLRAGNGLRADRGDALERGGLAHDDDARRLQDPGRARFASRRSMRSCSRIRSRRIR